MTITKSGCYSHTKTMASVYVDDLNYYHYKNKVVKITNIVVSTVARI